MVGLVHNRSCRVAAAEVVDVSSGNFGARYLHYTLMVVDMIAGHIGGWYLPSVTHILCMVNARTTLQSLTGL